MYITDCDREPIHLSGAIQPEGILLILAASTMQIVGGADDMAQKLGADWQSKPVREVAGELIADRLGICEHQRCQIGWIESLASDVTAFRSGDYWLIQFEPSEGPEPALDVLAWMDEMGGLFERAANLGELYQRASDAFSTLPADDAVNIGLILVELVINAQKYAYDGAPGPILVVVEQHRARFRLIVADKGKRRSGNRQGFGSRMLSAMVKRLSGTIENDDNRPGLRVIFSAPIDPTSRLPMHAFRSEDDLAEEIN